MRTESSAVNTMVLLFSLETSSCLGRLGSRQPLWYPGHHSEFDRIPPTHHPTNTCSPCEEQVRVGILPQPLADVRVVENLPAAPDIVSEVPQLQLSCVDEVDNGAESILADLLHQHLVLPGHLHVAILIAMNYGMRTEIEK